MVIAPQDFGQRHYAHVRVLVRTPMRANVRVLDLSSTTLASTAIGSERDDHEVKERTFVPTHVDAVLSS